MLATWGMTLVSRSDLGMAPESEPLVIPVALVVPSMWTYLRVRSRVPAEVRGIFSFILEGPNLAALPAILPLKIMSEGVPVAWQNSPVPPKQPVLDSVQHLVV